jgi:hypothetical protein
VTRGATIYRFDHFLSESCGLPIPLSMRGLGSSPELEEARERARAVVERIRERARHVDG